MFIIQRFFYEKPQTDTHTHAHQTRYSKCVDKEWSGATESDEGSECFWRFV